MSEEPYASARRVLWIVDNGSSHRGRKAVERLQRRWRNLVLVHVPVHASWLNQIEIYYSIVQRKVLEPNEFNVKGANIGVALLGRAGWEDRRYGFLLPLPRRPGCAGGVRSQPPRSGREGSRTARAPA